MNREVLLNILTFFRNLISVFGLWIGLKLLLRQPIDYDIVDIIIGMATAGCMLKL